MGLTGGTNDSPQRNDVGVVVVHIERHISIRRILRRNNLVVVVVVVVVIVVGGGGGGFVSF